MKTILAIIGLFLLYIALCIGAGTAIDALVIDKVLSRKGIMGHRVTDKQRAFITSALTF